MEIAILHEMRTDNPAHGIKKYPSKNPQGIHTWTEDEITQYYDRHKLGTNAYLAVTLMLWTAAAVGDASRMGWDNVVDGCIEYRRQKTRAKVDRLIKIPIKPDLEEALNLVPEGQETFLWTSRGGPYSQFSLGGMMRGWCDEAGLPQCSAHGLRKACARRLADAIASPHEIQAITGHADLSMVAHYTTAANRDHLATSGMAKIPTRSEREQKVVNHHKRFANNDQ